MDQKGGGSVHLQIDEIGSARPTIFEPQSSIETKESSNANSVSPSTPPVRAPEKNLTLFALRLAVLEKAATGLGTLGFVWATVVLLGGFAITLEKSDFWFITIILLIEGTRIFSRSHELEWQHQATWSIADVGINSFLENQRNRDNQKMPSREWVASDVPLLPYAPWVFLSRNVSKLLYWLQLASATARGIAGPLSVFSMPWPWQKLCYFSWKKPTGNGRSCTVKCWRR